MSEGPITEAEFERLCEFGYIDAKGTRWTMFGDNMDLDYSVNCKGTTKSGKPCKQQVDCDDPVKLCHWHKAQRP